MCTTEAFLIYNVKDHALKKSIVCEAIVKTIVKLSYTKYLLRTADQMIEHNTAALVYHCLIYTCCHSNLAGKLSSLAVADEHSSCTSG